MLSFVIQQLMLTWTVVLPVIILLWHTISAKFLRSLDYSNVNRRISVSLIDLFISSNKNAPYLVFYNNIYNQYNTPASNRKEEEEVSEGRGEQYWRAACHRVYAYHVWRLQNSNTTEELRDSQDSCLGFFSWYFDKYLNQSKFMEETYLFPCSQVAVLQNRRSTV